MKAIAFGLLGLCFLAIAWVIVIVASLTRCKKCHHWCSDEAECAINQWKDQQ